MLAELDFSVGEVSRCIRHDCGASFFVTYHSRSELGGTSIRGLVCKAKYAGESGSISLEGIIPGEKIAGVITLEVSICIDEHKDDFGKDASFDESVLASDYGAVLFSDEKDIILEGAQTYFPVADIDFNKKSYNGSALYFLQRNRFATLDSDFFSAYRLYFNNTHPMFGMINNSTAKGGDVLSMVTYDVFHELVMDALNALHDGLFSMNDERGEDSHTVRTVYINTLEKLRKYFDGLDLGEIWKKVQDRKSKEYSEFVCNLQAYLLDTEASK